jgi:hypothetical protein
MWSYRALCFSYLARKIQNDICKLKKLNLTKYLYIQCINNFKTKTGASKVIFLTVSKLQAGQLTICDSIPRSGNTFFTSKDCPYQFWGLINIYRMGTRLCFTRSEVVRIGNLPLTSTSWKLHPPLPHILLWCEQWWYFFKFYSTYAHLN